MVSLEYLMEKHERLGRFNNLHPKVLWGAKELIARSYAEGIPILITQGYRSIAQQNELYSQGRTAKGSVVTNAKGGQSYHNFGLAIDYVLLADDGVTPLWSVNSKWKRVAAIGKSLGFEWGGDWRSFKDYPHLEMNFGLSTAQLRAGKKPPSFTPPSTPQKSSGPAETIKKPEAKKEVENMTLSLPGSIKKSVAKVLQRFEEKKDNPIDPKWRKALNEGHLTESEAIGLLYVALDRGLIQGFGEKSKPEEQKPEDQK
ncbi:MAG: M15 family metallopeptidase [Bacillus sp. (in: firmicutes)]